MRFSVLTGRFLPRGSPEGCYLQADSWNDYGFRTLFRLQYVDSDGKATNFGGVKLGQKLLQSGDVRIAKSFERLDASFFSLGQDQNYYESLAAFPHGSEILFSLRDCIADTAILTSIRSEPSFRTSLMRSIQDVALEKFRQVLFGGATPTPFSFDLRFGKRKEKRTPLSFAVTPGSLPPTNIHAIIGRNGVGKSTLLHHFASALVHSKATRQNAFVQLGPESQYEFANVVTVAFSVFDGFEPLATGLTQDVDQRAANYHYVGMRVTRSDTANSGSDTQFKTPSELGREFSASLEACLNGPRERRWLETTQLLCSDPGFAAIRLTREDDFGSIDHKSATLAFGSLSSGHRIALLTLTRLVELVDDKTLVLIDEPESHLHPPLLSSLVRAVSHLLLLRNGVAIVATHSPVVLQEVPRSCVWILRRHGNVGNAERPSMETFGENIGTLTREVFQLETVATGFNKLVAEKSKDRTYVDVLALFGQQLGGEARAVAQIETAELDALLDAPFDDVD